MAIQMRRGQLANYDKSKMLPGEWGISIDNDSDNQKAFISFAPGVSKEVMMVEDAEEQIAVATAEAIDMATEEAKAWAHGNSFHVNDYASGDGSTKSFTLAETPSSILGVYVDGSSVSAYTLSGKTITFTTAPSSGSNNIRVYYTVNTTTDNAKYYKEQAEAVAESIPEDYSDLSDDVDQLKNALITDSASGSIASFADGGDGFPVRDLKVQMEPIQDLHGYDHPWPAGGGKNKLNYDEWKGRLITRGTAVWVNNGVTLTATVNDCYTDFESEKSRVYVTPDSPVTLCWEAGNIDGYVYIFAYTSNGTQIQLWYANNATVKKLTITAPSNAAYITFRFGVSNSGETIEYKNIQVLFSSEVTPYEPYSNICPISGRDSVTVTRTGKNLFNPSQLLLANGWSVDSNGVYSGTRGNFHNAFSTGFPELPPFKEETQYTLSLKARLSEASSFARICFHYTDGSTSTAMDIASETETVFTATSNVGKTITTISGTYGSGGNNLLYLSEIQLEESISQTAYEPYQGQTVTIPLGQTVYGGTVDVTTGVLTVDKIGYVFTDGTNLTEGSDGDANWLCVKHTVTSGLFNTAKRAQNICSYAPFTFANVNGACHFYTTGGVFQLFVPKSTYSTLSAFTASLATNPLIYVALLAAPQTYQLTPQQVTTLLGQNNVWSDADSVAVDYVADTKLYIAKVIADALS